MIETWLDGQQLRLLLQVGVAALLGALIGFDRETADKPAGLRTHILVASAAALLVLLGEVVVKEVYFDLGGGTVRTDPIRIIEAVVTGVSFLGAGTIIYRGAKGDGDGEVEGLTTAASILFCAAVGISVALSQMTLAVGVTIMALVTLRGISWLIEWIKDR